jgi:hypothetical protein
MYTSPFTHILQYTFLFSGHAHLRMFITANNGTCNGIGDLIAERIVIVRTGAGPQTGMDVTNIRLMEQSTDLICHSLRHIGTPTLPYTLQKTLEVALMKK